MTNGEALQAVRSLATVDSKILIQTHARDRMTERNVRFADIRSALVNAQTAVLGTTADWAVTGPDQAGAPLTVALNITACLIIVTVF